MKTHTFSRGVHPREGKELAEHAALEVLPVPDEVRLPMAQNIGAPCTPVVKNRDVVEAGQMVGEAGAFVSAAVFTPYAGTVTKIAMVTLANGRHVPAVVVKVDKEKTFAAVKADMPDAEDAAIQAEYARRVKQAFLAVPENFNLDAHTPEEIISAVRSAGLVGQGGAAFPTHVKLMRDEKAPVDTLLVNGCECEPYLTADYRVMLEAPELVVRGAQLAAKAAGATRVMLCVEDNKPEAIRALDAVISREKLAGVSVAVMKTKYPQGGEKQLIMAALRRKVAVGALPKSVGAAVINVGTAVSIAHAVLGKQPLVMRAVTVTGEGITRGANVLAPVGVSMRALVDYCGGLTENASRILAGGPMMGFAVGTVDIPVTKGTSGITILTNAEISQAKHTNCIRCGRCVSACPMGLIPTKLAMLARAKQWDAFAKFHPLACVECGCCAYDCPASIPIVQLIRIGKIAAAPKK